MSVALVFPGQGSQVVGMGRDLYDTSPAARAIFDQADATLGFALTRLCFEGPEEALTATENAQPALLTVSAALLAELAPSAERWSFVAGHSLGEYSAHVASGTLDFADAVRIVRNRGRYMQAAVPAGQGAMAAVLGLSLGEIEAACREAAQG
ncbi:MAG TPA: ACP S-malonyltransferase, partial [Roseiflexaceae bacterium]